MSQKAHQNPDPKHTPMSNPKRYGPPITGASPDDPIGLMPDGTGQPGQPVSPVPLVPLVPVRK
jgi:hypothetical protein